MFTPQELPGMCLDAQDWLRTEHARTTYEIACTTGFYDWVTRYEMLSASEFPLGWQLAATYAISLSGMKMYVNTAMTRLAVKMAPSMPSWKLETHDLPAPSGVMMFEEEIVSSSLKDDSRIEVTARDDGGVDLEFEPGGPGVSGVAWWTDPGRNFVVMTTIALRDDYPYLQERDNPHPRLTDRHDSCAVLLGKAGTWVAGQSGDRNTDGNYREGDMDKIVTTVLAAWRIAAQRRIADVADVEPSRAHRRRAARQHPGEELGSVRVIALRLPERPPGAAAGEAGQDAAARGPGRVYTHTWFVREHWRNQWCPSVKAHRPVLIAEHVKGPEGAPLLTGEKVHALIR